MKRNRHVLRIVLLALAIAAVSGCDGVFGVYCDDNAGCDSDQVCRQGICVGGEQPSDAGVVDELSITSVLGDGTLLPIGSPPDNIDDPVLSPRRLTDRLVVRGTGLDAVDEARLVPDGGTSTILEIAGARSDGAIEVILPRNLSPGLMTLTLAASTLSTSVSAQVFILQGEDAPSPPPIVSSVVAASAAQCANGGQVLTVGPDADGDGAPDSGEAVVLCNGTPGDPSALSCEDDDCTITANLEVNGALKVDGNDAVRVIREDETRTVASLAALELEMAALQSVRIAAGATVTMQLGNSNYVPAAPFKLQHPDSARIAFVGNTNDPGAVSWRCNPTCFDVTEATFQIDGIEVTGATDLEGTGFEVGHGGVVELGATVRIINLDRAFAVRDGGTLLAENLTISNSVNGVFVDGEGIARIPATTFEMVRFPVIAVGGVIDVTGALYTTTAPVDGHIAIQAYSGSSILASGSTISNFAKAVISDGNTTVFFDNSSVTNCLTAVSAARMGMVEADFVTLDSCSDLGFEAANFGFMSATNATYNETPNTALADGTSLIVEVE